MDAYIVHPNVVTCLGSGEPLWRELLQGASGLTPAGDVYPDWFPENKSQIGAIRGLTPTRSRLLQIMEMLGSRTFPKEIDECQLILGASSLGDLEGPYAGDPYGCMKHYFETAHPGLAPRFRGVVSSACSSGTDVLSLAAILVDQQRYDVVGVLAADCLDPGKLLQHFALGTQAEVKAMPFDKNRTGTSFGEGGGFAIVANRSGLGRLNADTAYQLLGFGMSCDAMYITAPDETGENPSLAIIRALAASKCTPSDIGYINAHASGTPLNDQVESIAFRRALGPALDETRISGTKGAVGHLLGGTGLVEMVFSCWALSHGVAPGTAGLTALDEALAVPAIAQGHTQPIVDPIAISTTFGFGGVNSAVLVQKTH